MAPLRTSAKIGTHLKLHMGPKLAQLQADKDLDKPN